MSDDVRVYVESDPVYKAGVAAGRKQAYADVATRMDAYLAACRKFGMDDKPVQKMADEIRGYR